MMNKRQSLTHSVYSHMLTGSKMEKEECKSKGSAQLVNICLRHWWSQPNEAQRYMDGGKGEK